VHRIGRTGRAGAEGTALSFCDFEEKAFLADIEKLIGKKVPVIFEHPFPMQQFHANKTSQDAGWGKPRNVRGRAPQHEGGFGAKGGQKRRFSSNKTKRG
jgi:ATP-dependent RNA helicase RhlE